MTPYSRGFNVDIFVMNEKLETIYIVDAYKSIIWTDRYREAGDFELYTEVSGEVLKYITKDRYLSIKDSERTMIVSSIEVESDRDLGNKIKITGKSLESILNRRIIWGLKVLNTDLQNGIKTLLNECVISPSDSARKIPNFIFEESSDERITKLKMDNQYTGDNLYDVIYQLCLENDLGFKVVLNNTGQFVFSLYAGVDRSYNQTTNPFVTFSPKYENLVNSNYLDSNADMKNITLIAGEGEDNARTYTTYAISEETGLNRRELFTDARDLQSKYYDNGTEHTIPHTQYIKNLQDRGKSNLLDYSAITAFEGEVEPRSSFIYRRDYELGDIVQIENEYDFRGTARISEVVASQDDQGYSLYPTFEMMEVEDEEGGN